MCTVTCLLNWLETDAYIRDMAELLGVDGLELKAANEAELPYEGQVVKNFNLIQDDSDHTITVLFLIAKDFLDVPIVGFNVIEEITKHFDRGSSARANGSLVDVLTSSEVKKGGGLCSVHHI